MVYPYSYYYHPYRFIGKRSADAETKASPDADPQGVPPGLLLAPVPLIRRLFGKRSADAETKASPDADPQGVPPGLLLAPVPLIRRLFGKRSA